MLFDGSVGLNHVITNVARPGRSLANGTDVVRESAQAGVGSRSRQRQRIAQPAAITRSKDG